MQCLTELTKTQNRPGVAAGFHLAEVAMNHANDEIAGPDRGHDALAETHAPEAVAGGYQPRFSLPSGSRPLDGYTIKRGVGAGGFGEVYYATSDAGKDVALKRIQRNLDIELRGVRQCLNLKHPNLLSLFDIRYDEEGQAWVVMEYVSGENLQCVIERNPNGMPLDQVHFWLDGIIAGVGHLHECGIVHRDLKPGNIFLDAATVKIGDYGLSKFISCSRRSGQTQSVGTFHYMAPEIGQGRYGKEIDVYALGVMLYEMLTGHVPYDGESSQEIIMKHLTALPPVDRLPSPYREVIARALAKDPAERYSDVAELRAVLPGGIATTGAPTNAAAPPRTPLPPLELAPAAPTANALGSGPRSVWDSIQYALQGSWRELVGQWERLSTGWQVLLLAAAMTMLFTTKDALFGLAIGAGLYGFFLHQSRERREKSDRLAHAPAIATAPPQPAKKRESRRARRNRIRQEKEVFDQRVRISLSHKTAGQRWSEMLGSLLMVSLVTCVVSVAACLLVVQITGARRFEVIPNFLWIMLSSTLAAWGVLAVSKPWEGTVHDHGMRRFMMLILGFLVGAASFGLSRFLSFQPARIVPIEGLNSGHLHAADGAPLVGAYLIYFGALFLLARWWLQSDPMRRRRVCYNTTIGIVILAFALDALFQVPQGFLVAGTSSLAIQFAAPWLTPDQRKVFDDPAFALARSGEGAGPFASM